MDIKRSILLVALAVVAYLMVLQWNQDYGQTAIPDETRLEQSSAAQLPSVPATASNENGQVIKQIEAKFEKGETETTATFDLPIEVRNQVTKITIDNENSAGATVAMSDTD